MHITHMHLFGFRSELKDLKEGRCSTEKKIDDIHRAVVGIDRRSAYSYDFDLPAVSNEHVDELFNNIDVACVLCCVLCSP